MLLTLALSLGSVVADPVDGLRPLGPENGVASGASPIFRLGFDESDDIDPRALRFRLTLRSDDDGPDLVFDQTRRRRGWTLGRTGEMLFRPPRPLPDGEFHWFVEGWDGTAWRGATRARALRIDSIPPAPVEGLRVRVAPEGAAIELVWNPVTVDMQGGSEYVVRYHVYRSSRRGRIPLTPEYRLGTSTEPRFRHPFPPDGESGIGFYRVVAEDEAGNIAGRRR